MKPFARALFIFSIWIHPIFAGAQSAIDVLHYQFAIDLSDNSDTLKGKAFVTVQFSDTATKFWLNLASPNDKGKGMATWLVRQNNETLAAAQSNDTLTIWLKKPAHKNDTATYEISYGGIPADGLIISKNKYGDRTFFADNWPNRARNWIPCKDEPDDKASFEFLVTAPSIYKVISNGKLIAERALPGKRKFTHWKEDVSLSTKVMVIGVAKFAVKQFEDSPHGIPVSAWVYPQDSVSGFINYAPAPSIVKYFSDYIGAYPYNKLANVQSKTIFGGMENASAIFYFEESARENKSFEDLLAHEIAHQWFGDMASEKSFPHLWLSEGFASYLTDIYLESKYGTDSMSRRLLDERNDVASFAQQSGRPVVDSISSLMNLLNANSYQKGAWILHMLRRQLGDSVFRAFIRTYYDRFKGKNADTHDLESVIEEVSHQDLQQFFRQWLYTPGIPALSIKWTYKNDEKKISVTVTQLQQQGAFHFPLELALRYSDGKSQVEKIMITQQTEFFSIPVRDTVTNIYPDPNISLLFKATTEKLEP